VLRTALSTERPRPSTSSWNFAKTAISPPSFASMLRLHAASVCDGCPGDAIARAWNAGTQESTLGACADTCPCPSGRRNFESAELSLRRRDGRVICTNACTRQKMGSMWAEKWGRHRYKRSGKRMEESRIWSLFFQLACALHECHSRKLKILHRSPLPYPLAAAVSPCCGRGCEI